ncbi:MAG: hypothetical protein PF439_02050 [Helicobacteraceae bacterium]|nr:hypothetical protein [Helicobacteraceae bacterium]
MIFRNADRKPHYRKDTAADIPPTPMAVNLCNPSLEVSDISETLCHKKV